MSVENNSVNKEPEGDERREVELHVATCDACTRALAETRGVLASMALTAPPAVHTRPTTQPGDAKPLAVRSQPPPGGTYSSCRRSQVWNASPLSRPFGTRSRIG